MDSTCDSQKTPGLKLRNFWAELDKKTKELKMKKRDMTLAIAFKDDTKELLRERKEELLALKVSKTSG